MSTHINSTVTLVESAKKQIQEWQPVGEAEYFKPNLHISFDSFDYNNKMTVNMNGYLKITVTSTVLHYFLCLTQCNPSISLTSSSDVDSNFTISL